MSRSASREAFELLCGLVMPDGQEWGAVATSVQRRDAKAVLSSRGPRKHWVGRSRGFGKTEDVGAFVVVSMICLLVPGSEAFCCARDKDQARILVDRIKGFIRRSGLEGLFERLDTYVIVTKTGARLEALSCDTSSAYGLSPALLVIDELCQWPETAAARELLDALMTGLPKVKGSRCVIITTSGSPGHFSKEIFDRAEREDSWRVSMTYGPCPWMDPAEVEEARRALPPSTFARLFENRWAQGADRLFSPEDVAACVCLPGAVGYDQRFRYSVAVDLGLRNDRAVVGVGHVEDDALCVDRMDVFTPSKGRDIVLGDVEGLIHTRYREYHAPVTFDPAMAAQMMQTLRRRGVHCVEHTFTAASNSKRVMLLLQLSREHRMRLPDDRELVAELLNTRIREVGPNVYRHDHDPSRHDDRVTVLGLLALLCEGTVGGPVTTSAQAARRTSLASGVGESRPTASARPRLSGGSQQEKYLRAAGIDPRVLRRKGRF